MKIAIVQNDDYKILHIYEAPIENYGGKWGDLEKVTHIEFDDSVLTGDIMSQDDGLGGVKIIAAPDKPERIKNKYYKDVNKELEKVFGSSSRDKVTADTLTWILMDIKPDLYMGKGLVDDLKVPLSSEAEIKAYAATKLETVADYGMFLITRGKKYKKDAKL